MEKKYKLTKESIEYNGSKLYRIEALKDFGSVHKGDKGGWIESEFNLSHRGECWVYNEAKVYEFADVYNNATIRENAVVCCKAIISGNAEIYGNALICDYAEVKGNSMVYNNAQVGGYADLFGHAIVRDDAVVKGGATVTEAKVGGHALVTGDVFLTGGAEIIGDAVVSSKRDYITFKNWWSVDCIFTWTRSNDMWCVGSFYGSGNDLLSKINETDKESGKEYERIINYVNSIK